MSVATTGVASLALCGTVGTAAMSLGWQVLKAYIASDPHKPALFWSVARDPHLLEYRGSHPCWPDGVGTRYRVHCYDLCMLSTATGPYESGSRRGSDGSCGEEACVATSPSVAGVGFDWASEFSRVWSFLARFDSEHERCYGASSHEVEKIALPLSLEGHGSCGFDDRHQTGPRV